ncbi:hypothetical protein, conserved, partial [Eimeria tenella]
MYSYLPRRSSNNSSSSNTSSSSSSSSSTVFIRALHNAAPEGPKQAAEAAAGAAGEAAPAAAAAAEAAAAAAAAAAAKMPLRGWALLGCSLALLAGGLGSAVWLFLDSPEPLKVAWDAIQKDPRVVGALGGEVKRGWWWGGFVHEKDARVKLSLT